MNTTTSNSMRIITNNISTLLLLGIITRATAIDLGLGQHHIPFNIPSPSPLLCNVLTFLREPWCHLGYGIWDNHGFTSDPTCTCKEDEYRGKRSARLRLMIVTIVSRNVKVPNTTMIGAMKRSPHHSNTKYINHKSNLQPSLML